MLLVGQNGPVAWHWGHSLLLFDDSAFHPCRCICLCAAAQLPPNNRPYLEVPLEGVESNALEAILRFLYTSNLSVSPDTIVPILDTGDVGQPLIAARLPYTCLTQPMPHACLLFAAVKLEMHSILGVCEQYLQQALSPATLVPMLEQALSMGQSTLAAQLIAWAGPRRVWG